jgi:uncharacterized protein YggE
VLAGQDSSVVLTLPTPLSLRVGAMTRQCSGAAGRKARLEALSKLRQEASDAAGALGMSVAGYQDIDLTGGSNPPTPFFPRPRPMMMAAAMAAPIATPDAQTITETVAADVLLRVTPAQSPNH